RGLASRHPVVRYRAFPSLPAAGCAELAHEVAGQRYHPVLFADSLAELPRGGVMPPSPRRSPRRQPGACPCPGSCASPTCPRRHRGPAHHVLAELFLVDLDPLHGIARNVGYTTHGSFSRLWPWLKRHHAAVGHPRGYRARECESAAIQSEHPPFVAKPLALLRRVREVVGT